MSTGKHIAIAGATGAVGVEMLKCLEERNFPVASLKLLASARSRGKKMTFRGQELTVEELTPDSFAGVEIAFSAFRPRSRPPVSVRLSLRDVGGAAHIQH